MLDTRSRPNEPDTREDFTADLHQTMLQLGRYQRSRELPSEIIDHTYDKPHQDRAAAADAIARASLAAVIAAVLLAMAVTTLATPLPARATPTVAILA